MHRLKLTNTPGLINVIKWGVNKLLVICYVQVMDMILSNSILVRGEIL